MMRRISNGALVALSAVALSGAGSSVSRADSGSTNQLQRADRLMGYLAAHDWNGFSDDDVPEATLLERIRHGGRIHVLCSVIADIGRQVAIAHGIPARLVFTLTNRPFNGNDGHALVELRISGRWVLYDLDHNRRAIDKHGQPNGLVAQIKAGHDRRWYLIAHDGGPGISAEEYDRVFGTALIETSPGEYAYHTAHDERHIDVEYPGAYWVTAAAWRRFGG